MPTADAARYTPSLADPLLILPRPKRLTMPAPADPFRLTARTRLVVPDRAPQEERRGVTILQAEIRERFGLSLPIVPASQIKGAGGDILFDGPAANPLVRDAPNPEGLPDAPYRPEGYMVGVTPSHVILRGHDTAGTLWAAQTAVQLLARGQDGAPVVRPAIVEDWPTLSLRAAHLFFGHQALPFHKKLIGRILSRYKMNALFLQSEQVHWDADPKVAPAWAGTKAQVWQEILFAREHGMVVYPLLESFGHMDWLLANGGHLDYAEDPDRPFVLNYTNEAAVRHMEAINIEADRLFEAPGFHVGFDEITLRGRFPYRSRPKPFTTLFLQAANRWHTQLTERHREMWMWADMTMHPSEVAPDFGDAPTAQDADVIRRGLPKDIVMVDWQYEPHDRYPSLGWLQRAGFTKIVAATWWDPRNIQAFSRAAARAGVLGAMQTTWCGYESREDVLKSDDRKQFTSMILAADYFWNGGDGPSPEKLPYDAAAVLAREWGDRPLVP